MTMEGDKVPLAFNIQMLKWLQFWPKSDKITLCYALKNFAFNFHVHFAGYTAAVAAIRQIIFGVDDAVGLVESLIGFIDFVGFAYMNCCFFSNMSSIKYLARSTCDFQQFCPLDYIATTEDKVQKYSKAIFAYSFLGNSINACLALYGGITNCKRTEELLFQRDPCGYPCRCYFPMDVSQPPLYWFMYSAQTYTCFIISLGVLAVTMFIVGVLIHTVAQLKHCRKMISGCSLEKGESPKVLEENVKEIIKYHIMITEYSKQTNLAFSSMMLFHLTVTSLIISVLGFNIVIVENVTDCLRFGLHLIGWFLLLFLICYYGQQLIDESTNVGVAAYSIPWFNAPVLVQKDLLLIIARAQRPLNLTAYNLGVMSFEIFLKVIKGAYSYFTLFLNLEK